MAIRGAASAPGPGAGEVKFGAAPAAQAVCQYH